MSSVITKSSKKKDKRQVNLHLEREYRDCIKSRRDKIRITRHIMMHQVLYIVQLPNEEHIIIIVMICLVILMFSLLLFIQSLHSLSKLHLLV